MIVGPLVTALQRREAECRAVIDQHLGDHADRWVLREAAELMGCLRRVLPSIPLKELHRAFGAPGDFGYQTPIGDALHRIYLAAASAPDELRSSDDVGGASGELAPELDRLQARKTDLERALAERQGLARISVTDAELRDWRELARTLTVVLEGHDNPWSGLGSVLNRLLDALDALTQELPPPPKAEPIREGVRSATGSVDMCSCVIGLVSQYSDDLKMTFAATLIRQLAFDLAARAELTPRELMIQMAHRALGVYRVGPGEVVR